MIQATQAGPCRIERVGLSKGGYSGSGIDHTWHWRGASILTWMGLGYWNSLRPEDMLRRFRVT